MWEGNDQRGWELRGQGVSKNPVQCSRSGFFQEGVPSALTDVLEWSPREDRAWPVASLKRNEF